VINLRNDNLKKIKSKTFGNIALLILWAGLIFILIKGTVSIAKPVEIDTYDIENQTQKENSKKLLELRATAFAENFIRDYMTYLGDEEDYAKRLKEFISDDMVIENPRIFNTSYVNSTKIKWIDEEVILVDCIVKGSGKENSDTLNTEETYYMRAAVNIIDDKFLISDYPTLISTAKKATKDDKEPKEEIEDKNERKQIEKVVKSFLTAYYEGKNTEIEYFVDGISTNESSKSFKFKELKDFSIYMDSENIFHAKASYYVGKDDDKLLQNMEFRPKIKDDKFVILKYDTKI
jgi:hypothetical protein